MANNNDFEINYWGNTSDYQSHKKSRSLRKKLLIVLCFTAILGITPTLIFGINKIQINKSNEISSIAIITPTAKHPQEKVQTPTPTPKSSTLVQKGDSYWRISKRNCGTGKYYLSIKDQNESKPLYLGDSIKIVCTP